ncbi:MAG: hypothetical protein QM722_00930 [Piscinibacter sp.]
MILRRLLPPLGLAIFLGIWEAVPRLGLVNPAFLPPPSVLPAAFLRELASAANGRRRSGTRSATTRSG